MAQTISDVMTPEPRTCDVDASALDAAREMRDADIGDVLVTEQDRLCGIVTDRDIVVRVIAEGRDPGSTKLGEACTRDVATLSPDDSVEDAIRLVREQDVRRIPVVEDGRPAGIVSIGDLAIARDSDSALADISAAPANN
jgi:CBS domain-containing protein